MTEAEYKELWLNGESETQTDYNDARFVDNKLDYAKKWVAEHINYENEYTKIVIPQKYRMITDPAFCELCSRWVDKISVYDELASYGLDSIALPYNCMHYGEMTLDDFHGLNGNYIVKCNHGSGWNKFINTETVDKAFIVDQINSWQKLNYAYITGYEAQYKDIKPGVLIQPDMNCSGKVHTFKDILLDYSFYCYQGEIMSIALTKKISKAIEEHIAFVDKEGHGIERVIGLAHYEMYDLTKTLKRIVDEMKPYVYKIASLFDFVRVDMYYINGKVYFGETTFTPSAGRIAVKERI